MSNWILEAAAKTGNACTEHPAFTKDNCPRCGTSRQI